MKAKKLFLSTYNKIRLFVRVSAVESQSGKP